MAYLYAYLAGFVVTLFIVAPDPTLRKVAAEPTHGGPMSPSKLAFLCCALWPVVIVVLLWKWAFHFASRGVK